MEKEYKYNGDYKMKLDELNEYAKEFGYSVRGEPRDIYVGTSENGKILYDKRIEISLENSNDSSKNRTFCVYGDQQFEDEIKRLIKEL